MPVTLAVGEASLNQLNQRGEIIAQYNYKDILEMFKVSILNRCKYQYNCQVSDSPGTFCIVYGDQRRLVGQQCI